MTTETKEENHAISNAKGWSETITALVAAMNVDYDRLEELRDELQSFEDDVEDALDDNDEKTARERLAAWHAENDDELRELLEDATVDGEVMPDADTARERIEESPLSVEVRSGWYSPSDTPEPEEFAILLTTGGPALRIRGELDEHKQPRRAWLEYQDWGTPWTQFFESAGAPSQADLLAFASVFYFGE